MMLTNKLIFWVILLLPATLLAQTTRYTPAQIERVAKLSELYGHIKFFHPYLGYKPINWDSAFAVAAPLVAQARTDDETVAAIRQLLAVLNDDGTTVELTTKPTATTPATPTTTDSMRVYFTADSTLVLKTNNYAGADDYTVSTKLLESFMRQLPKARSVLLDIRNGRRFDYKALKEFISAWYRLKPTQLLSAEPILTAGWRKRSYSGFAPEFGQTSGGYWSGFTAQSGQRMAPGRGARNRPLVIIANMDAVLPGDLLALRHHAHVQFYSSTPLSDLVSTPTSRFALSETIFVDFRTGESVNPDGSTGLSDIALLPPTVKPEAVEQYVFDQLRTPQPRSKGQPTFLPMPPDLPPTNYPAGRYPALGYRLLAGAKIWSVIHYFFAYKDLMPTDWNANFRTALAELGAAPDSTGYALAVAHFYRNIQDTHGNINSSVMRHYVGAGNVPVDVQFVEGKPTVIRVWADSVAAKGIRVGDVITTVHGEPVAARIARLATIIPASNEWSRRDILARQLVRGPVGGPVRIGLLGADGTTKTITLTGQPIAQQPPYFRDTTAKFRVLPGNIGYVELRRLQVADVDAMFDALMRTKAIIFDMRGYPNGTAWSIAPRLTSRRNVVAARFTRYAPADPDIPEGQLSNPTQKYSFDDQIPPKDGKPSYTGKTVMLIDERTISQAESTGLFFEAANGTEFIGSPTAGANGDVTNFSIPGGLRLSFSGHDVRHADGRPLQQVGLQPKILARPTINGIRAGKDEVLERAVQYLNTGK